MSIILDSAIALLTPVGVNVLGSTTDGDVNTYAYLNFGLEHGQYRRLAAKLNGLSDAGTLTLDGSLWARVVA